MKPIILSIKRDGFRGDQPDPDKGLAEFKSVRPSILERDLYQCQFCDFDTKKYQEIHHLDDNHENNSPDNLITTCTLCHMCFHIGFAGIKNRGVLIYCKEGKNVSNFQARLNNLTRNLWACVASNDKKLAVRATDFLKRLESLRVPASDYLGTSDPVFLANYLRDLSDEDYEKRKDILSGIYLLPLREGYPEHVKYWNSKILKNKSLESSTSIAKSRAMDWISISSNSQTMSGLKKYLNDNNGLF